MGGPLQISTLLFLLCSNLIKLHITCLREAMHDYTVDLWMLQHPSIHTCTHTRTYARAHTDLGPQQVFAENILSLSLSLSLSPSLPLPLDCSRYNNIVILVLMLVLVWICLHLLLLRSLTVLSLCEPTVACCWVYRNQTIPWRSVNSSIAMGGKFGWGIAVARHV